jgi:mono/diheme cytochrome c family protein
MRRISLRRKRGMGFSMRNTVCRALALIAALAPGASASGGGSSQAASALSRGQSFDEQGGAALFAAVCAGCHQPDASGTIGAGDYPALAGNKDVASSEYLERLLFKGQRGMPAVGQLMSDQQVADVINYVRSHFGNAYGDAVSPADVEAARRRSHTGP